MHHVHALPRVVSHSLWGKNISYVSYWSSVFKAVFVHALKHQQVNWFGPLMDPLWYVLRLALLWLSLIGKIAGMGMNHQTAPFSVWAFGFSKSFLFFSPVGNQVAEVEIETCLFLLLTILRPEPLSISSIEPCVYDRTWWRQPVYLCSLPCRICRQDSNDRCITRYLILFSLTMADILQRFAWIVASSLLFFSHKWPCQLVCCQLIPEGADSANTLFLQPFL